MRIGCQQQSHTTINWKIDKWQKSVQGKVFTDTLNEYDGGEHGETTVSLSSEYKTPTTTGNSSGISTGFTTSLSYKVPKHNNDDFIGTGYLYFIDNPTLQEVSIGPKVYLDFASEL